MPRTSVDRVGIAVLAKAPVPGMVKTRLASALGHDGAAQFHARLVIRTVETACAARTGPVTLWAAPDPGHEIFATLAARFSLRLARQPDGDLGVRMHAAVAGADGPTLVIGSDCPVLTPHRLQEAADVLRKGIECAIIPAQDGGYVLIGLRRPQPALFQAMTWSVPGVLAETRRRIAAGRLTVQELASLWDVDVPEDLSRLRAAGLQDLAAGIDMGFQQTA